jgi:hypothetical protein
VIDEDQNGDGNAAPRRLRKTRLLQSEKSRAIDNQSGDLPVFLVNRDRASWIPDGTPRSASNIQSRINAPLAGFRAALALRYQATRTKVSSFVRRFSQLPLLLQREDVRWQAARVVLITSLLPLALFVTFGRAPQTQKKAEPVSQTLPPLPPVFELEKRLAFARPLSDRLLSHALEQSIEQSASSEPHTRGAETTLPGVKVDEEKQAAGPIELSTDATPAPQTLAQDQNLRLPFDGQSYKPTDLPGTAQGSFIAELAMSELMSERTERPRIAENDVRTVVSPPKTKPKKVATRKKMIAQRKRPAQVNQMTASATQPPVIQQQPNLPPPPILFFLGAPPPPPQTGSQGPPP